MTAKHSPATSLPWHPDLNRIYANGDKAPQIAYCPKESEGRHGIKRSESEDNAAYIVHAANAYPKLVAEVENLIDLLESAVRAMQYAKTQSHNEEAAIKRANRLLRELGEAE